ncbi:MAG: hypothetical protein HQL57_10040 [Magnetococcales bacterium]|nr:hypothetical protein [Magnetococcales bacterium]MBF0157511.1 hypothetical protein [Magnetococcales bacterium]
MAVINGDAHLEVVCQTVEDWLSAYVNSRSDQAREVILSHMVESVEDLIALSRKVAASCLAVMNGGE